MNQERQSTYFLLFYTAVLILVVAVTYYRFFVVKGYPVLNAEDRPYTLPAWVADTFNEPEE